MGFADKTTTHDVDAQEFARRQKALGANPVETIKEIRARYGLEVHPARALVVTPEEVGKFLRSERASGVSRLEARRSLKRRFACGGKEALGYVDASGLWSDEGRAV